jgi:DNA ligase-1
MRLADVVATSTTLAATRSRRTKIAELAGLLARAEPGEVAIVVGFLTGEPRQGKVGIGYASVYGLDVAPATEATLEVVDVDRVLDRVPSLSGAGSQRSRGDLLTELFALATEDEQAFLRRLLTGELRQGALEGVMTDAVAAAAELDAGLVRRAVMLGGDLGQTARIALAQGEAGVRGVGLQVLRPVRSMLASTAPSVEAALGAVGEASVEWKLDGARIQVHREGDRVGVFTRNLNDVTARLPRVVEVVRALPVRTIVLDGEAMTFDEAERPRGFPETMSRFGADTAPDDVPLLPFFFDLLHLDGEDLIDLPLVERLDALDRLVPAPARVPRVVTSDLAQATAVLDEAHRLLHEGVMVKGARSTYEAGRRGAAWLKVKRAHTLDLVVLAAEWGHGRRTGWLSNLHLGARDPATGGYVMLGKTFKGLTDEMLRWQTARFLELEERRTAQTVYLRPEVVVEIAFDGVLPSPRYPGGMALRFARVKGYRSDKDPQDADTIETVRAIFEGA